MARGRFISKEISVDKNVNALKNPWSMLAFTWLLAHADVEGRTYGDPAIVRSMVFPRLNTEVTVDNMEQFIKDWQALGLIDWYEVDGDMFIQFPNFFKHQVGLRKDREPDSIIPPNPSNKIPTNDGKLPEIVRQNDGTPRDEVEVKLSRSEVEGELKVEVEVPRAGGYNNDNPSQWVAQDEIDQFETLSGLSAPKPNQETFIRWIEALQRLKVSGADKEIQLRAFQELTEKKYRIAGPWSIEKACAMILAEKRRESIPKTRTPDSKGEFSEFIRH